MHNLIAKITLLLMLAVLLGVFAAPGPARAWGDPEITQTQKAEMDSLYKELYTKMNNLMFPKPVHDQYRGYMIRLQERMSYRRSEYAKAGSQSGRGPLLKSDYDYFKQVEKDADEYTKSLKGPPAQ